MDPITGLSGMLDPSAFSEGSAAFGTKVSNEYVQIINKLNEAITGLNEVAVDQIADEAQIATNVADIATNVSGIAANAAQASTNASGIAANVSDISDNTDEIAAINAAYPTGILHVTANLAAFDYATYGGNSIINLDGAASKLSVTMGAPSDWPAGSKVSFMCSGELGAVLDSSYFLPGNSVNLANMAYGDTVDAISFYDTGSGTYRWNVTKKEKASSPVDWSILTATQTYTMTTGLLHTAFTVVDSQSPANVAVVNLPALDNSLIGIKLYGAMPGAGTLRFTANGTDRILDADGADNATLDVTDTAGNAFVVLIAMPYNGSIRRWAASIA